MSLLPSVIPAILALADGTVFKGQSIGADGITSGEVVFNTAMSGYQAVTFVNKYGICKPKFTNGCGYLRNLIIAMSSGVKCIRNQITDFCLFIGGKLII